jgi:hypothetical protein
MAWRAANGYGPREVAKDKSQELDEAEEEAATSKDDDDDARDSDAEASRDDDDDARDSDAEASREDDDDAPEEEPESEPEPKAEADEADEDEADEDEADEPDEDEPKGKRAKASKPDDDDEDAVARAGEVAKSLGVGEEEEEAEEEAAEGEEDKPAKLNRAQRRRQRALRRRQGDEAVAQEESPRDRNKKKRDDLLKRRRRAAEASEEDEDEDKKAGLLPSEMVDDALARGGDATLKWLQRNWKVVQWVVTAAIVGGIGTLGFLWWTGKSTAEVSDQLAKAIRDEAATVIKPDDDTREEDDKKNDIRTIFASYEERDNAALADYRAVADKGGDGAAAILARLGEAGLLLDQRKWDESIGAYDAVLASPLAGADVDPDVRARAFEGKGFAQEGKKDLDGALQSFEKLNELSADYYKALSLYHQARVYVAKGQKDQAKNKLVEAQKLIETARIATRKDADVHPYRWLERAAQEELQAIDPNAAPLIKPGQMSPEQLQQLLQQKGLSPEMPQELPIELPPE